MLKKVFARQGFESHVNVNDDMKKLRRNNDKGVWDVVVVMVALLGDDEVKVCLIVRGFVCITFYEILLIYKAPSQTFYCFASPPNEVVSLLDSHIYFIDAQL